MIFMLFTEFYELELTHSSSHQYINIINLYDFWQIRVDESLVRSHCKFSLSGILHNSIKLDFKILKIFVVKW
jgi:hypothetical protein